MLLGYVSRLTSTAVGAWLKPAVALLDEVRTPLRLHVSDIDVYGHLNNGRYLTLMDMGRWELSLRTGLFRAAVRDGWRPVAAAATVRFRRELKAFDRVELTTAIRGWDERAFYVEHRLEKAGQVHAVGFVQLVSKRGRETVPPARLFAQRGVEGPSPTLEPSLAAWVASLRQR